MYRLTTFGDLTLPVYNPVTTWPTPVLRNSYQQTSSGVFRGDGTGRARHEFPYTVTYKCVAYDEVDIETLRGVVDDWRGQVGEVADLVREPEDALSDADERQWAVAELASAPYVREHFHADWLELTFEFSVLEYWRAPGDNPWELDSGVLLDDGRDLDEGIATTFVIPDGTNGATSFTNEGKVPTEDVFLSITAGSAPLEQIIVFSGYVNSQWSFKLGQSGTTLLEAGETITIDTSKYEILKNGAPAYSDFRFFSNHKIDAWIRIMPGPNLINWVADGGGGDGTLILNWKPEYL